jgi:uncharacterized protein involved in exopolysaccharide biosynthesis
MTGLNAASAPQYEDEIDFQRYVRFFTSHWLILLGGCIGGALIAVVMSSFIPLRFQSTATLMVVQPSGATPLVLTPATAKTLLVDPAMVSEIIHDLGLNRDGVTTQRFIDDSLDVEPVPGTNVVRLNVVLTDPATARQAATLLASKVIDLSERIGRDAPSLSRKALEKQLAEADRNLQDAEERLVKFQLNANLDAVQAETASKTSRRADVDSVAIALESERARLASLEQELAHQPAQLNAPLPRDAATALRSRQNAGGIVETDPFANPVYTMLQYDIAQSRATISRLERQERQTLAMTSGSASVSRRAELYGGRLQLARLQAEYDARFRIYNGVLSQYEDASRPAASVAQLQMVAPPVQPDQPMPRKRRQFALLGGIIGLVCGLVAAVMIDRRRPLS